MHKESHQTLDLLNLFEPISKFRTQVVQPETIPEVVRKAFKQAEAEKPGVSYIDFPEDVAKMDVVGKQPLKVQRGMQPVPPPEKIRQAADIISHAKYPLIMAGNGVIRAGAAKELLHFASTLHIPVASTFMAKGVIPFSHCLWLGAVGMRARLRCLRVRPGRRDNLRRLRHGRVSTQLVESRQGPADRAYRLFPC